MVAWAAFYTPGFMLSSSFMDFAHFNAEPIIVKETLKLKSQPVDVLQDTCNDIRQERGRINCFSIYSISNAGCNLHATSYVSNFHVTVEAAVLTSARDIRVDYDRFFTRSSCSSFRDSSTADRRPELQDDVRGNVPRDVPANDRSFLVRLLPICNSFHARMCVRDSDIDSCSRLAYIIRRCERGRTIPRFTRLIREDRAFNVSATAAAALELRTHVTRMRIGDVISCVRAKQRAFSPRNFRAIERGDFRSRARERCHPISSATSSGFAAHTSAPALTRCNVP